MKTPGSPSKLVCLLLVMMGSASSQQITVQNDQSSPVVLSAADIAALPHTTLKVNGHDGPASFSGVPVSTLLEKAGIAFGESLRGKRLASCLLVEAADGYRVVMALPEVDPSFTDKQILLLDKPETHPLFACSVRARRNRGSISIMRGGTHNPRWKPKQSGRSRIEML